MLLTLCSCYFVVDSMCSDERRVCVVDSMCWDERRVCVVDSMLVLFCCRLYVLGREACLCCRLYARVILL